VRHLSKVVAELQRREVDLVVVGVITVGRAGP
jgi:hypothetical protein